MYLLDTNVISELRKVGDGKADLNVTDFLAGADHADFFLSVITLMELEIGVLRLTRRNPEHGNQLRLWMKEQVLPEFLDRSLPVDSAIAMCCAELHVADPRSERDALIAATALTHGMTVVTRNTSDFAYTGLSIFNPWLPVKH